MLVRPVSSNDFCASIHTACSCWQTVHAVWTDEHCSKNCQETKFKKFFDEAWEVPGSVCFEVWATHIADDPPRPSQLQSWSRVLRSSYSRPPFDVELKHACLGAVTCRKTPTEGNPEFFKLPIGSERIYLSGLHIQSTISPAISNHR